MLSNRYSKCYFTIIERARARGKIVGERHHIIPASLSGTNVKSNLVWLTLKEHFICHLLLTKMTDGQDQRKMQAAFSLMAGRFRGNIKRLTARMYSTARSGLAARAREQWADPKFRANMSEKSKLRAQAKLADGWEPPWKGKPRSAENRKAISNAQRGKKHTEERKAKGRRPCLYLGVQYTTFGEAKKVHKALKHSGVIWLRDAPVSEAKRRADISSKLGSACIFDGVRYSSIRQANLIAGLGQKIKDDPRFSYL